MATAAKTVHIVKTPGVRGGKARIEGTRICVMDVVASHQQGKAADQILEHYPPLTLPQVQAALDYYEAHRDEIDAEFAAETDFFENAERKWDELVARNGGRPPDDPTPEERALPRPFPWPPKK